MVSQSTEVGWSDAQWSQVYEAVSEEANKLSVAGSFLHCFGPLSRSAGVTSRQWLDESAGDARGYPLLEVDDDPNISFWTLAVHVRLTQQQLADEKLASALMAFRRGANLLVRAEDAIVFQGLRGFHAVGGDNTRLLSLNNGIPQYGGSPQVRVSGTGPEVGLVVEGREIPIGQVPRTGQAIVTAIVSAITQLEDRGHLGPFACVLGNDAFDHAHTPDSSSLVMPSDRMEPMLGTALLRSGTMPHDEGIVVSLAGDPIDLVVATAPTVQYLHITDDGQHLFRVYERFALRIKEHYAVSGFRVAPPPPGAPDPTVPGFEPPPPGGSRSRRG